MVIYTRGADRLWFPGATNTNPDDQVDIEISRIISLLIEQVAFSAADSLWESFQEGISNFAGPGNAIINDSDIHRPFVGEEFVNILRNTDPIDFIECGN